MISPSHGQELHSGEWRGNYVQFGNAYRQRMVLEFADGIIRGDGIDGVSPFLIDGEYRLDEGRLKMGWIKTYQGGHSVLYLGELENGKITGKWEIWRIDSGEFSLEPAAKS